MSIDDKLLNLTIQNFDNDLKSYELHVATIFKDICITENLDRCFCKFFDNHADCNFTISWQQEGCSDLLEIKDDFNFGDFSWALGNSQKRKIYYINSIDDLPIEAQAERLFVTKFNIKSMIIIPIIIEGAFGGICGFTNFRQTRNWSDSDKYLLKKVASVLGTSIRQFYLDLISCNKHLNHPIIESKTACFIIDLSLQKITFISNESNDLFNLTPYDILSNSNLNELIPNSKNSVFYELLDNLKEGKYYSSDIRIVTAYGKYKWVECSFRKNKNNIQGFMTDITEKKQYELDSNKHNQFLAKLIDNIPVGIIAKNGETGVYEVWNKEFERISGIDRNKAIGKTDYHLFPKEQADKYITTDLMVKQNKTVVQQGIIDFRNKSNQVIKLNNNKFPIFYEGEVDAILCVNQDVTESVAKEIALEAAINKKDEAEDLKTQFLSNISHEFRTPLSAVYGFSEYLNSSKNIEPKERDEYLALIMESSKRLISLMDNVINVSKLESKNINLLVTEFSLTDTIIDIAKHYTFELADKKVDVELLIDIPKDIEVILNSDENNIRTALGNLLNNAIKFTNKGSIKLGFRVMATDKVMFFVEDTGVGISKEKKKFIFDLFKQGNGTYTREFGGIGVGLTICHNIINMLGGNIVVDSTENEGTAFLVEVPGKITMIKETDIKESITKKLKIHPIKEINNKWEGKTIMIVDDTVHIIKFFKAVFKHINVNLAFACNGLEAVEKAQQQDIDLILMDIQMPKMNGLEATSKIREFNKKIPIIAQTAYTFDDERNKILKAGCDGYLTKPINKKELFSTISKYMY